MKGFLIAAILSVSICAISTAPPITAAPPTVKPPTVKPPTVPTVKPPTVPTVAPPSTLIPIDKDQLLKKAAELDKKATDEIAKFAKLNRTSLVSNIDILDQSIKELAEKIKITSGVLPLQVLESQLFWIERELDTEIDAIEAAYTMVVKLLNNAADLDAKIAAGITKVGADTPVGKALAEEKVALARVVKSLREAKDARTIQLLEFDLALIEERVYHELGQ